MGWGEGPSGGVLHQRERLAVLVLVIAGGARVADVVLHHHRPVIERQALQPLERGHRRFDPPDRRKIARPLLLHRGGPRPPLSHRDLGLFPGPAYVTSHPAPPPQLPPPNPTSRH